MPPVCVVVVGCCASRGVKEQITPALEFSRFFVCLEGLQCHTADRYSTFIIVLGIEYPDMPGININVFPAKGAHLIRYYGWYSNKSRYMFKYAQAEASAEPSSEDSTSAAAATRSSQTWAMLIKRVYEIDPFCLAPSAAAR